MGKRVITGENDLLTWCQSNGDFGQQLINEWTGLCDDGNHYSIIEIAKSSTKRVLWKCNKGHEWYVDIHNRTNGHTSCKYCTANSTSYPEQFIYWSIKQIYPQTISRGKYQGVEFDITIPEIKTCIEYSPTRWHSVKDTIDNNKKILCELHSVRYIQIIEDTDNKMEHKTSNNYICFHMIDYKKDDCCKWLVGNVLEMIGHSVDEIDFSIVTKYARDYSLGTIDASKSLLNKHNELAKEWHKTLNNTSPDKVLYRSHLIVFWQCTKCNYGNNGEWKASINRRTAKGYETGCPQCGYNWNDMKYHKKTYFHPVIEKCNITKEFPELAIEWHPTLNSTTPDKVTKGHSGKIYWQCPNCSYGSNGEWQAPPARRTAKGHESGCPQCGYNWFRAMTGQEQKLRKKYKLQLSKL